MHPISARIVVFLSSSGVQFWFGEILAGWTHSKEVDYGWWQVQGKERPQSDIFDMAITKPLGTSLSVQCQKLFTFKAWHDLSRKRTSLPDCGQVMLQLRSFAIWMCKMMFWGHSFTPRIHVITETNFIA